MKVALIAAMARNGAIGKGNALPWRLPEDLKYFKAVTLGKPVVMGRKTYESIGRPLPGRTNIVVTRDSGWPVPSGVVRAKNLNEALEMAGDALGSDAAADDEIMIMGGGEIYRNSLPYADKIYLTLVELDVDGDVYFPSLSDETWQRVSTTPGDPAAAVAHSFCVYERIGDKTTKKPL